MGLALEATIDVLNAYPGGSDNGAGAERLAGTIKNINHIAADKVNNQIKSEPDRTDAISYASFQALYEPHRHKEHKVPFLPSLSALRGAASALQNLGVPWCLCGLLLQW